MIHEQATLPKPYYDCDGITIYNADCKSILPGLRGDVVLTDLPYGIGLDYGDSYEDSEANLDELASVVVPLMRQAAPVVGFTCGVANIWRFPAPRWVLCWYMANACASTGRWGFNQWQPLLCYGTDPYLRNQMGRRPDVIITAAPNSGRDKRRAHPCPKPTEAWRKVLRRLCPLGSELIVDPFMGSGTTLDVAKYSGHRAIGVEINERYCEIAAKRLEQGVLF